jgi:hypothetical protein
MGALWDWATSLLGTTGDPADARTALSAAKSGANSDITSLTGLKAGPVPVRQTVLSGPVDSSGLPSFGGSTGGTTVTASGTLIATAANGFSAAGADNRVGSITNPSWTGLSTNGAMYLYLDIAADGTCTPGSTTLAPTYQWGGTYSTTSGQFTFNIQEMVGKVGNGSAAAQTYRVFVGEVTVASSVVSAITWYALMRRAYLRDTGTPSTTRLSKNHNLGVPPNKWTVEIECQTTDLNYAVLDRVPVEQLTNAGSAAITTSVDRLSVGVISNTGGLYLNNKTTASQLAYTAANWDTIFTIGTDW